MIRITRLLILLIVLGNVVYYLAFAFYPPAGAFLVLAVGRGPDASFRESLRGFWRYYQHSQVLSNKYTKSWRVVQTDPHGFQLVETPRGRYWEPGTSGSVVPEQLSELDTKYLGFPGLPVQKGGVVLDCGANIGTFTRGALDAGAGVVVAVEPAPENIFCLRKNFSSEIASGRVIVYEKGVWDKDDFLTLEEDDVTSAEDSFVRRDHKHTGPVLPLTTIDKLVQELKLPRVDFIKMDIEGAEQRALKGAQATLAKYHPRLEISVNHLPEDPKMVPIIVKQGWPGYRQTLLRCSGDPRHWRIEADIIFFD